MKTFAPQEWLELGENLYQAILNEIEAFNLESQFKDQSLARLEQMYQFFRLLRGEGFDASRPRGLGEIQRQMYSMEYEIRVKIDELKKKTS